MRGAQADRQQMRSCLLWVLKGGADTKQAKVLFFCVNQARLIGALGMH